MPQDVFREHGFDLAQLAPDAYCEGFRQALERLVRITQGHLRDALQYTLLIPKHETEIRQFCLWAIGMAVLTLRKIARNPRFRSGSEVKYLAAQCEARHPREPSVGRKQHPAEAAFRDCRDWPAPDRAQARRRDHARISGSVMTPRDSVRSEVLERVAEPPSAISAIQGTRGGLDAATGNALRALLAAQEPEGHWCDQSGSRLHHSRRVRADDALPRRNRYPSRAAPRRAHLRARARSAADGRSTGGAFDLSCSVKAYYALKLVGDDPQEPHMAAARAAILAHGGAARANVFTRIALAFFGQVPWRGIPFMPVELIPGPRWSPFHLDKIWYWSRTVLVPLLILCSLKGRGGEIRAASSVRELFTVALRAGESLLSDCASNRLERVPLDLAELNRRLACSRERLIPKVLRLGGALPRSRRLVPRAPERPGRTGRHFPGHGECVRSASTPLGYPPS